MTWALVLTSGAGMSRYGPSTIEMRWVKRRVRRSSSSFESFFGSTVTPPFAPPKGMSMSAVRSEEHTSELQSRQYLVCRLLLEKKKKIRNQHQKLWTTLPVGRVLIHC